MELDLFEINYYFINLEEHTDRKNSILKKLLSLGIADSRIERIEGVKAEGIPQDNVFRGCFISQLNALKIGRSKGTPFIILEDDVEINSFKRIIEIPNNSQCVYLGLSSWGFSPSIYSNLSSLNGIKFNNINTEISRVYNMLSSHSILYIDMNYVDNLIIELEKNLEGKEIISEKEKTGLKYFGGNFLPCDVIMANQQSKGEVYALRNPIFYQGGKHQYCTLFQI